MVCEKCKTQIPDDSKFCKECGVRVAPLPKPAVVPATLRPPSKVPAPAPAPAAVPPSAPAATSPAVPSSPKPPAAVPAPRPSPQVSPAKPVQSPVSQADANPKETTAPASAPVAADAPPNDVKNLSAIIKYKLVFKVVSGGLAGKKYSADEPTVINIGRGSNCTISISKEIDPAVSRNHCRLDIVPPRAELTDLGSSNGTYINETRIEPNKKYALKSGDAFKVGENVFSVEIKSIRAGSETSPAQE